MQKIRPFLWFDSEAEEAAKLYTSVFRNAKLGKAVRNGDAERGSKSKVMSIEFELEGLEFIALNGGPHFKFNEAISLVVDCTSQAEVDDLWEKLTTGGTPSRCGWLKDRFGLSWQIIPRVLVQLLSDPDPAKSKRVMEAMMQMTKIDIARLQQAHAG